MPSIIKVRTPTDWGTAFCIAGTHGLRFFTAAHVLTNCGISAGTPSGQIEICDDQSALAIPQHVNISGLLWTECDVVEFACEFAAIPFPYSPNIGAPGVPVAVAGYLFMPGQPREPDCGVVTRLKGAVANRGIRPTGQCDTLSINLQTAEPHLFGMSGSPVTTPIDGFPHVIALLNGAGNAAGGPPFLATVF